MGTNKHNKRRIVERTLENPNTPIDQAVKPKLPFKVNRAIKLLQRPQIMALMQFETPYEKSMILQEFVKMLGIDTTKAIVLLKRGMNKAPRPNRKSKDI